MRSTALFPRTVVSLLAALWRNFASASIASQRSWRGSALVLALFAFCSAPTPALFRPRSRMFPRLVENSAQSGAHDLIEVSAATAKCLTPQSTTGDPPEHKRIMMGPQRTRGVNILWAIVRGFAKGGCQSRRAGCCVSRYFQLFHCY